MAVLLAAVPVPPVELGVCACSAALLSSSKARSVDRMDLSPVV